MSRTVECDAHGSQQECFVCVHLVDGERQGFISYPDGRNPRPDAWCSKCERARTWFGDSWDEVPKEKRPTIKVVCGECYDLIQAKNILGSE